MILSMNDDGIINSARLVSIIINPFNESEFIYTMADGQFFKEEFESKEAATEAFEAIDLKTFIDLTNNRKINGMYAKDVLVDPLDDTKVVFVMYNGAPQKEKYDTNKLAKARVTDAISKLKAATEFEDGGDPSDLANYYTKVQADEKFAAKSSLAEYIKTTDADGKYAQKSELGSYVQTSVADSTYAKKSELSGYVPTSTADEKYAQKSELGSYAQKSELGSYVQTSTAESTYAKKTDLEGYMQTSVADGKYAEKTSLDSYVKTETAESTYAKKSEIPTATSQLSNDSNFVEDTDYVHTDENFTTELKGKLDGLNNYVLPTANGSTLGGIKLGTGLTDAGEGVINVDFSSITSQISALEGRIEALESKPQA